MNRHHDALALCDKSAEPADFGGVAVGIAAACTALANWDARWGDVMWL